jgi:hypothetical protein
VPKFANETIIVNRVYTFGVTPICVKVQLLGKNDECVISGAIKAEEIMEAESGNRILVLTNEKNEVIGKFKASQVAGWWLA